MEGRAYSRADSSLACGHGRGGAHHVCAGLAGRQLHRRGHGVSGPGGVVGDPGRDRSLALHRGSVRAFLRLFLSASRITPSAGRRAGVGGNDFLRAQLRGGEPGGGARAPADPAGRTAAGGRGAALRPEPGDDAFRGCRPADPRPARADRPHLCARGVVLYVCDQDRFTPRPAKLPASVQATCGP